MNECGCVSDYLNFKILSASDLLELLGNSFSFSSELSGVFIKVEPYHNNLVLKRVVGMVYSRPDIEEDCLESVLKVTRSNWGGVFEIEQLQFSVYSGGFLTKNCLSFGMGVPLVKEKKEYHKETYYLIIGQMISSELEVGLFCNKHSWNGKIIV